jgi:phosphate binding protein
MKKVLVVLAALMLALPIFAVSAQEGTIVDVAASNPDFSTLVAAVQAAGLVDVLNGEGPFTVFAPTNAAFEALPEGAVEYLLANTDLLTQVLTYHVIAGNAIMSETVLGLPEPTEIETAQGGTVLVDPAGKVEGANIIAVDIAASNGVIHVIDAVILPEITLPEVDPLSVTGDIITAGSSTVFPLTEYVATQFRADGYAGSITVDSIGTGAGFERFCVAGETDISNASRAIRQREIDSCLALNPPRKPLEFFVAIDALAVVVAESNTFATELTIDQIARIFSGELRRWSDVNPSWPAEEIQLFSPGTDSGTFDYFVEAVMRRVLGEGGRDAIINAPGIQFSEDDNVLVAGVEGSPFSIGYFGFAYYVDETDRLNAVAVEGIEANEQNAETGVYPLARPLFIYSDAGIFERKPQVADFVNYYINIAPEASLAVGYFPTSRQGNRLAKLNWLIGTAGMSM